MSTIFITGLRVPMEMPVSPDEPKRQRVMEAAAGVFLNYGFQRTTMDDIARAAEMSRPALYLLFRNKTDIYRAIAAQMLEEALRLGQTALAGPGTIEARLMRMLDVAMLDAMARFSEAPHGAEILDMKNSIAADIIAAWRISMRRSIAAAIAGEQADGAAGADAGDLADILLDGLEGMKMRLREVGELRRGVRALVAVVAGAARRGQ
jgi:AcrR family transcriptional regulator